MSVRVRIGGAILVGAVAIAACSSPSTPSGTSGTGTTTTASNGRVMTAVINGVNWSAVSSSIFATRLTDNYVNVSGADASPTAIAFAVQATGPGTFQVPVQGTPTNTSSNANNANLSVGVQRWESSLLAVGSSGTVTITSLNSTGVVGTFSFTMLPSPAIGFGAAGTKVVTNGVFSVPF